MMGSLQLHSDPAGFPMIWLSELQAYIHWLPVTKIQFEYFLCDAPDRHFDAAWYEEVLRLNPRRSPHQLVSTNYWNGIISGLQPLEAQRFAYWAGPGYRLPTAGEWSHVYRLLQIRPARDLGSLLENRTERARQLLLRINDASRAALLQLRQQQTLADQLLMRGGVLEWTLLEETEPGWGLRGEPLPAFCGTLSTAAAAGAIAPTDPEGTRFASAGFRLLFFPETSDD